MRRQFVSDLCVRKSVPKGLLRYAVTDALANPSDFARAKDDVFAALAKLDGKKAEQWDSTFGQHLAEKATDTRLPLVLFAQVAASVESAMGVHTWRNLRYATRERAYLAFLAAQGYTLSDIERQVADGECHTKVRPIRPTALTPSQGVDDDLPDEPEAEEGDEGDPDDVA